MGGLSTKGIRCLLLGHTLHTTPIKLLVGIFELEWLMAPPYNDTSSHAVSWTSRKFV